MARNPFTFQVVIFMRWILALNGRGWGGFKDLTAKKKSGTRMNADGRG
jgi:hypothetical protein